MNLLKNPLVVNLVLKPLIQTTVGLVTEKLNNRKQKKSQKLEHEQKVQALETKLNNLQAQILTQDQTLSSVHSKVDAVDSKVESVKLELDSKANVVNNEAIFK